MKHTVNKIGLLGLCLLLSVFAIGSMVNAADTGVRIRPDYPATVWYRSVLHTLNLGEMTSPTATLKEDGGKLKFTNGLVVGDNSKVNNSQNVVIGGGKDNRITNNSNYAAIGGGNGNEVQAQYGIIGGGNANKVLGENGVVVGGMSNQAEAQSVVVGGKSNRGLNGGVVIGGNNNKGYKNSLALGNNSTGNQGSFAWNGNAGENAAYIGALSGILVGTTTPINGVNLVVDGAVRVAGTNDNTNKYKGEIRYIGGCFYGYDGVKWYVLNRGNEANPDCNGFGSESVSTYCKFGNTIVWHGDILTGYSVAHAVNCSNSYKTLICDGTDGNLYVYDTVHKVRTNTIANNYYPYCYKVKDN